VAEVDVSLLTTFKRVQQFEKEDVALLAHMLRNFDSILTTPHILSETSNFIDQAPLYRRAKLIETFQQYVDKHQERYEPAVNLVSRQEFAQLGLSDTGLSSLSDIAVVITTDFRLAGKIEAMGGRAINFNQARSARLLS
jgi:hypothetical protein